MWFVVIGTIALVLKWQEIGPVAHWPWWLVLLPFGLAFLWWQYADSTGLTQRRAMDKMEARKEARRHKAMDALGISWQRDQRTRVFKDTRKREAERVEAEREAKRQKNKDVAHSGFGAASAKPGGHATDEDTRLE